MCVYVGSLSCLLNKLYTWKQTYVLCIYTGIKTCQKGNLRKMRVSMTTYYPRSNGINKLT